MEIFSSYFYLFGIPNYSEENIKGVETASSEKLSNQQMK